MNWLTEEVTAKVGSALAQRCSTFCATILCNETRYVAVALVTSVVLMSEALAALRPLFSAKTAPPFTCETILRDDDLICGRPVKKMPGAQQQRCCKNQLHDCHF
jgi:hypothetical protein